MHTSRLGKIICTRTCVLGFPGGASGNESTCQCRRHKRCGFDPWSSRRSGVGSGSPLQYPCLENPMERGAWQATVHRTTKSWTPLSDYRFTSHFHMYTHMFFKEVNYIVHFRKISHQVDIIRKGKTLVLWKIKVCELLLCVFCVIRTTFCYKTSRVKSSYMWMSQKHC